MGSQPTVQVFRDSTDSAERALIKFDLPSRVEPFWVAVFGAAPSLPVSIQWKSRGPMTPDEALTFSKVLVLAAEMATTLAGPVGS